jgi:cytoskeletal protein CcmA (bactofilin family)
MFGRKKNSISGRIDTLIARSARLQGDVEFSGGLHLEGHVIGHVRTQAGEAATLWVSEQGCVEGSVDVPNVVLNGTVKGDVHARDRVVIGATARITGNVHYGTIEMALGAQVSGKLIPMGAGANTATATTVTSRGSEPAGRPMAAEMPPAAVDAIFDARRSGT